MTTVMQFIQAHPAVTALAVYWLFSAAISSMPMPTDKSSPGYRWFFGFTHLLAGSVSRMVAMKYPNLMQNGNVPADPNVKGTAAGN